MSNTSFATDVLYEFEDIKEKFDYQFSRQEEEQIRDWIDETGLSTVTVFVVYVNEKKAGMTDAFIEKKLEKLPNPSPNPESFFLKTDNGSMKFSETKLASYLQQNFYFFTLRDGENLFIYKNGRYVEQGETYLREACQKLLKDRYKERYPERTLKNILQSRYKSRSRLNKYEEKINCPNGVLDIRTEDFRKHSPYDYFTIGIPTNYDPDANCPNFRDFIDDILDTDEKKKKIQEMFGYALASHYDFKKAFLLHGEGDNGKSLLLNVLRELLAQENVSSVTLQQLEQRFMPAELEGRLANISADIPDRELKNTGRIKELTGDDTSHVEKKRQDPFQLDNFATLIFSANEIPEATGRRNAFYSRWIIIEFPYTFTTTDDDGNKDAEPDLKEKLITDRELSGILNWALKGYQRLCKQGHFTGQRTANENQKIFERNSNPVSYFYLRRIKSDSGNWIKKDRLYEEFKQFCDSEDIETVPKQTFSQRLADLGVDKGRKQVNGNRFRIFKDIELA